MIPPLPPDDTGDGDEEDGTEDDGGGGDVPDDWPYSEEDYGEPPTDWPPHWPWPPFGDMPEDWPFSDYPHWPPFPGFRWPPLPRSRGWPLDPGHYVDPDTGVIYDQDGEIIDPNEITEDINPIPFSWEEFEERRRQEEQDRGGEGDQDVVNEGDEGTNQTNYQEFTEFDYVPEAIPSTFPSTIYSAPQEAQNLRIHGEVVPPLNVTTEKSMAFVGLENVAPGDTTDLYIGAEFIDYEGKRLQVLPLTEVGLLPGEGFKGFGIHLRWDHAAPGPGDFVAFISDANMVPIVAFHSGFEILSEEGNIHEHQEPPPPPSEAHLSDEVIHVARFTRRDIQPSFSGLANFVGVEETFNFIAREWVSVVVQIPWEAEQSGFHPRLRIYEASNPTTAVVDTTEPLLIGRTPMTDHTHSVGWAGDSLVPGQQYFLTVTSEGLAQGDTWQYFVFIEQEEIPMEFVLGVHTDGYLSGKLTSPVGRHVRIMSMRNGHWIDLHPNELGEVDNVRTRSVNGELLPVEHGDTVMVLSRGFMGDFNEAFNVIREVQL